MRNPEAPENFDLLLQWYVLVMWALASANASGSEATSASFVITLGTANLPDLVVVEGVGLDDDPGGARRVGRRQGEISRTRPSGV